MVIPADEKSPQEILSPDGKIKVLNHYSYTDRFGCYCIEGAAKNMDMQEDYNADIKIDYYDRDKALVDTEIESAIAPLKPGGTRSFYIMYSGERRGEIIYYKMYPTSRKADK